MPGGALLGWGTRLVGEVVINYRRERKKRGGKGMKKGGERRGGGS